MTETPRPTGSKQPIDLPLRRAMPLPLLAAFAIASLIAVAAAVALLLKPTTLVPTPLEARRPAPADGFSHEVGTIAPAPTPSQPPELPAPCDAFEGTRLVMSGDGVLRVREGLELLCRLAGGGVAPELATAIEGLGRASIRFAQFGASAVESTLEGDVVWLNLRFARRGTPVDEFVPVLVHEGYHLGSGSLEPDAYRELDARRAEVEACKHLVERDRWPRWCLDAEALVALPIGEAVRLLETVGFDAT